MTVSVLHKIQTISTVGKTAGETLKDGASILKGIKQVARIGTLLTYRYQLERTKLELERKKILAQLGAAGYVDPDQDLRPWIAKLQAARKQD